MALFGCQFGRTDRTSSQRVDVFYAPTKGEKATVKTGGTSMCSVDRHGNDLHYRCQEIIDVTERREFLSPA